MGLEPIWISPFDFKSNAYTNSAIRATTYTEHFTMFYHFLQHPTANTFHRKRTDPTISQNILLTRAHVYYQITLLVTLGQTTYIKGGKMKYAEIQQLIEGSLLAKPSLLVKETMPPARPITLSTNPASAKIIDRFPIRSAVANITSGSFDHPLTLVVLGSKDTRFVLSGFSSDRAFAAFIFSASIYFDFAAHFSKSSSTILFAQIIQSSAHRHRTICRRCHQLSYRLSSRITRHKHSTTRRLAILTSHHVAFFI